LPYPKNNNASGHISQNLSQKMKRDNFSEKEMRQITDALGLDLEIVMKEKK
jgi:hypothetical protein